MFNNELNDLTITSSEADDYFPNIRTISRGPDSTFLATLRALLVTRMTGGEEIMLYHVDTTIDELDSHIGDIYPARGTIITIIVEPIQKQDDKAWSKESKDCKFLRSVLLSQAHLFSIGFKSGE